MIYIKKFNIVFADVINCFDLYICIERFVLYIEKSNLFNE